MNERFWQQKYTELLATHNEVVQMLNRQATEQSTEQVKQVFTALAERVKEAKAKAANGDDAFQDAIAE